MYLLCQLVVPTRKLLCRDEFSLWAEYKQESVCTDRQRKHVEDFKLKDGVDNNK